MQVPAFVRRADNEDAYIMGGGQIYCLPVGVEDKVPVDIAEIKAAIFSVIQGLEYDVGRGVPREAGMTDEPLVLKFSGGSQAAVFPAGLPACRC